MNKVVEVSDVALWLSKRVTEEEIKWLNIPIFVDQKLYFTDGRMLVELECESLPPSVKFRTVVDGCLEGTKRKAPNFKEVLGDGTWDKPIDPPSVKGPPSESDERWRTMDKCDDCMGFGERQCDMGHDHECDSCNGEGKYLTVVDSASKPIEYSGWRYQQRYLWYAAQLPEVVFQQPNADGLLTFIFNNGRGVLMPLANGR